MLATNHALTGALIGSFLPLPVALPAAFASHFVMDCLPHYGVLPDHRNTSKTYRLIVTCDVLVALTGALGLAVLHKWHMEAGAWTAWSPDLLWVVYFFTHEKSLRIDPKNNFMRFHLAIQQWERPWGISGRVSVFWSAFTDLYNASPALNSGGLSDSGTKHVH